MEDEIYCTFDDSDKGEVLGEEILVEELEETDKVFLGEVLKDFFPSETEEYYIKDNHYMVKIPLTGEYFPMPDNNLAWCADFYFPHYVANFEYLSNFGIRYKRYYEICIEILHPYYRGYDRKAWEKCPLKFQIDSTRVEVGGMSKLFFAVVKHGSFISLTNQQGEIKYPTIKILLGEGKDYQEEVIKILFYLNTYYFKNTQFKAKLRDLYLFENFLNEYNDSDPYDICSEKLREMGREERDFISVEPLILWYNACVEEGVQKFLSLYRILEFFMQRAILNTIRMVRYDTDISEQSLYKIFNLRYEEKQLANLIEDVLDEECKRRIANLLIRGKLTSKGDTSNISSLLYNFRNSLVHAKENELDKTKLPNPFEVDNFVDQWIRVVEIIAFECIQKYNRK